MTNTLNQRAFTLIELLVVIAIIAILAGLALTILPQAADNAKRNQVRTQLRQLETAIGSYQSKHGFYPPDSPYGPNTNQLYYELTGVVWDDTAKLFRDLHGQTVNMSVFGVGGIVHSSRGEPIKNFLGQEVPTVDIGGAEMLKVRVDWPDNFPNPPIPGKPTINVWRYNSSSPVHNKNSYDLWAEIVLRGKLITIGNWERQ